MAKSDRDKSSSLVLMLLMLLVDTSDELRSFVDAQATARGDTRPDGYLCDLIRREQDRLHLRGQLLAGAESPVVATADDAWFDSLRDRTRRHSTT